MSTTAPRSDHLRSSKRHLARGVRKASDLARLDGYAPGLAHRIRRWEATYVMDDRASLHEFWSQPQPEGNLPTGYIGQLQRSEMLVKLIADVPKGARILEVGCNVGRNLAFLHDSGWTQVAGVEISPHAVDLLRATYPQLADRPIYLGPAEDVLPSLDGPYDLVFTMAVLEHIHPDSTAVFDQIGRLATSLLCIEPMENHVSHRQFPHDIRALFTERGFRCESEIAVADFLDRDMGNYAAWRFQKIR